MAREERTGIRGFALGTGDEFDYALRRDQVEELRGAEYHAGLNSSNDPDGIVNTARHFGMGAMTHNLNHFICPGCGHDFYVVGTAATCDGCGRFILIQESLTIRESTRAELAAVPPADRVHRTDPPTPNWKPGMPKTSPL